MISHTQRFFNPPGLLPPMPYAGNPLRALSRSVEDIHFDLNRNPLTDRQMHDNAKLFYDFKNKNMATLPYMTRNNAMMRQCYSPYPNMSPLYYKSPQERKDTNGDRSANLKSMWPMEHVGEYCAELLNRDKHYWTEEETGLMLELYEENKDYFNDNKTKKTKLWSVIANIINKRFSTNVNSEQCSQKYRNLKAEFLKIADPTSLDGGAKKFGRHFIQMKRLVDAEDKYLKGGAVNSSADDDTPEGDESLEKELEDIQSTGSIPSANEQVATLGQSNPTQILSSNSNEYQTLTPAQSMTTPTSLTGKCEEPISNDRKNASDPSENRAFDNSITNDYRNDTNNKPKESSNSETATDTCQEGQDKKQNESIMTNMDHLFREKNQYTVDMMQSGRCMSSSIGTVEHIAPSDHLREARNSLLNMMPQEPELLRMNHLPLRGGMGGCIDHNYSSAKVTPISVLSDNERTDFHVTPFYTSPYSNELKEIFSEYFYARNKDLEVYETNERQNIVCMNKCIDVFRKIMMEKIN